MTSIEYNGAEVMRKTCLMMIALISIALFTFGCGAKTPAPAAGEQNGQVTISFDYIKQSGYASNQFAVWIENAEGVFVRTLYATRFTAKGGYKNRPDALSAWVARSGLSKRQDTDAVTGATPKAGQLSYTWDLTDFSGARVADGTYRFFVEGTLRWKNSVLYSGDIEVGSQPAAADATKETYYEASQDQAALTQDAPENDMIGQVSARYDPPEQP